jgi:membrane-bound ClpP family serine protease
VITIACILALGGLLFIYLEYFLPGGMMAFIGSVFLLTSIFMVYFAKHSFLYVLIAIFMIICSLIAVMWLALKNVKKSKRSFYLDDDQSGFQASEYRKDLIGKTGVAKTDLRPSGHILVNEEYVQAVSNVGYIKMGEKVVILSGEGSRYIVQKA